MGKIKNHEKYLELLEENYFMLKVIKTSEDTVYLFEDSMRNIADSLRIIKKELECFGDVSDLFDKVEDLVESLESTAHSMAEAYMMLGEIIEDDEEES